MDEKSLILKAQQGDEHAFEKLIHDCLPKLQALLFKHYQLQESDAKDVIQVASNKAWTRLKTFRGESAFLTWFYSILRNEAYNLIKKRKTIEKHEVSVSNKHPSSEVENDEDFDFFGETLDERLEENAHSILERKETLDSYRQIINDVLSKLTPSHQEIIRLVMEEELSYKEIAARLNIPLGTVMSRISYAKQHAKKLIEQYANRNDIQLSCLG